MGVSLGLYENKNRERIKDGKDAKMEKFYDMKDNICMDGVCYPPLQIWCPDTHDDWQTKKGRIPTDEYQISEN